MDFDKDERNKDKNMQTVMMSGWLKTEPKLKCINKDGVQVFICTCLLKVASYTKKGYVFDYFQITAFGGKAEYMAKACHKESKILATGVMKNCNYKDQNGTKHYANYLLVNDIEIDKNLQADKEDKEEVAKPYDVVNETEVSFMIENGFMPIDETMFEDMPR